MTGFNELIQGKKPLLVDFHAAWCGPCKVMSPILKQAKDKLGDAIIIIKVDIDKNPHTAQQYGIQGVPTLILFQEGKMKWRQSGVVPFQNLINSIQQNVEVQ
jgi:thioredoxin 1